MSVFTSPILDNFNRANESPLRGGGNWNSNPMFDGVSTMNITGNQVASVSGLSAQAWMVTKYGDCEVFADISNYTTGIGNNTYGVWVRIQGAGTNPVNCYGIRMNTLTNWELLKIINSTFNSLGSGLSVPGIVSGRDAIGLRVYNQGGAALIEVWARINAVWQRIVAFADRTSPFLADGYIGLGCGPSNNIDNFGGGVIIAPVNSINADSLPGYTAPILQRGIEVKDAALAITSGYVVNSTVLSQPNRLLAKVSKLDHYSPMALTAKPNRDISRFVPPTLANYPYIHEGSTDGGSGGGISIY